MSSGCTITSSVGRGGKSGTYTSTSPVSVCRSGPTRASRSARQKWCSGAGAPSAVCRMTPMPARRPKRLSPPETRVDRRNDPQQHPAEIRTPNHQKPPNHENHERWKETNVPALKGSKTESNLKEAFAGESQANRRYLYFAQKADIEVYPDVAALFRSVAEGETGHAFGHFDFLAEVGDPVTGVPIGETDANLKSAIEGETYEYTEMYPGFSKTARDEGFEEVAEWLETLARAEKSHAGRFTEGLESVS